MDNNINKYNNLKYTDIIPPGVFMDSSSPGLKQNKELDYVR